MCTVSVVEQDQVRIPTAIGISYMFMASKERRKIFYKNNLHNCTTWVTGTHNFERKFTDGYGWLPIGLGHMCYATAPVQPPCCITFQGERLSLMNKVNPSNNYKKFVFFLASNDHWANKSFEMRSFQRKNRRESWELKFKEGERQGRSDYTNKVRGAQNRHQIRPN